jgi:NAD(P)-dependent dehydrogenase (short-subunit alcohol dehydrogenase family)
MHDDPARLLLNDSFWHNKTALVTGASSGLGLAIAEAFGAAGARVVLAARGHEVHAISADVTDQADVERLISETIAHYGRLDVLVNNAGRSARSAVLDTTPDAFREMYELNVVSVVRMTRAAAPHLLAAGGHLVNIGSLAGKAPARFMGAYGPTKAALTSYTQQLRLELGSEGLHVLLVCPGPIARMAPRKQGVSGADHTESEKVEKVSNLPASAMRPGAGVKTRAIAADWLSGQILRACERRKSELIVPVKARLLFALIQLSPTLGDFLIRRLT